MAKSNHLEAALAYARNLNWPVFPVKPKGKKPLTKNGLKDATKDEARIRTWWTEFSDANIGIPTGSASGFDVLDIDPRHGGNDSLDDLEAEFGKLPETVEQLTGGGGQHILFKHREDIRNKANLQPGLDVRGEGGYIVVAPSLHESGNSYHWDAASRPG